MTVFCPECGSLLKQMCEALPMMGAHAHPATRAAPDDARAASD